MAVTEGRGEGSRPNRTRDYDGRAEEREQKRKERQEQMQDRRGNWDHPQEKKTTPVTSNQQLPPSKSKEEEAFEKATNYQLGGIGQAEHIITSGAEAMQGFYKPLYQTGMNAFNKLSSGILKDEYTVKPTEFKFGEKQPDVYQPTQFNQQNWKDPGYDFRLQQGASAMNTSAAASGGGLSGAQLKALTSYGQQMGSQEYQNSFNRWGEQQKLNMLGNQTALDQYNTNRDFGYNAHQDLYANQVAQKQNQYNQLGSLANIGIGAGDKMAGIQAGTSQSLADLAIQKGNTQASGVIAPMDYNMQKYAIDQQMAAQKQSNRYGFWGNIAGIGAGLITGLATGNPAVGFATYGAVKGISNQMG